MSSRLVIRLLGLVVAAVFAVPASAAACSCAAPSPDPEPRDFFRDAPGAVIARLVSATPVPPTPEGFEQYGFDYD